MFYFIQSARLFGTKKRINPAKADHTPTISSWNSSFSFFDLFVVCSTAVCSSPGQTLYIILFHCAHSGQEKRQKHEQRKKRVSLGNGYWHRELRRPHPDSEGRFCDLMEESTRIAFSLDQKGALKCGGRNTAWGQPCDGREGTTKDCNVARAWETNTGHPTSEHGDMTSRNQTSHFYLRVCLRETGRRRAHFWRTELTPF